MLQTAVGSYYADSLLVLFYCYTILYYSSFLAFFSDPYSLFENIIFFIILAYIILIDCYIFVSYNFLLSAGDGY